MIARSVRLPLRRSISGLFVAVALGASAAVLTSEARAQPVDEATRTSARRLGEEATELFEKGDYLSALDKYERADALVHLPTLQVREARCLDRLGRLVEASERYLAATRMQLPPDALQVHRDALVDAETELAALRERIPSLVIEVSGGGRGEVTVDGVRVPAALWGQKRDVDPGRRRVELVSGATRVSRVVDVHEREVLRVKLDAPKGAEPPARAPERALVPESSPGAAQRIVGGVALGIGGTGLVVGAVTGGMVFSRKGDLEKRCGAALECPRAAWGDADSYNTLRVVSTSTLVIGGVLAAGGAVLILAAPKKRAADRAALAAWMGVGSVGVEGILR